MKVLVIHKAHSIINEVFNANGFSVDNKYNLSKEEIINILPLYDVLIVRSALKVDKEIIAAGTNLKAIGRLGAGLENIDITYANTKEIKVVNSPEGNRSAVGEQAVGMLLMLMNNLIKADAEVRKGIWKREENRGLEIEGKTIGIIGYGNMGGSFARKISGFGAKVIAYDKYKVNYGDKYATEVSLKDIFENADIVSLHTPLQDDTFHMVDTQFINSFAKPIFIINTSRGQVVKTEDLVSGLQNKKIKGACLDVLEFEGMSFESINSVDKSDVFNYLKESSNVVLSPHIAGWTIESEIKLAEILATKIVEILK
jgi:D-3-phosphoglycerate dehydrogenase